MNSIVLRLLISFWTRLSHYVWFSSFVEDFNFWNLGDSSIYFDSSDRQFIANHTYSFLISRYTRSASFFLNLQFRMGLANVSHGDDHLCLFKEFGREKRHRKKRSSVNSKRRLMKFISLRNFDRRVSFARSELHLYRQNQSTSDLFVRFLTFDFVLPLAIVASSAGTPPT